MKTLLARVRIFAPLLLWPAGAAAQQLSVNPPSAPEGATVTVQGFGFAGSACGVNLVWDSLDEAFQVSEPVPAVVINVDLRQLPRLEEWMPGDPIIDLPRGDPLPLEPVGAHLGTADVGPNGDFSFEAVVPRGVAPGRHLIWAQGLAPDGVDCKLSSEKAVAELVVEPPPQGQGAEAPAAGEDAAPHARLEPPLPEAEVAAEGRGGGALVPAAANFDGIASLGATVPDTIGDVGPRHYVQMVNAAFAVYDKFGNLLAGPTAINSLWAGQANLCATTNLGDPVVLYDPLADRWLLSQFAFGTDGFGFPTPPFFMAIAVSRGPDPVSSGWFTYCFETPNMPDYPKFGVWPNAYYLSTFEDRVLGIYAFDRANMLAGNPAVMVRKSIPSRGSDRARTRILPADLDGPAPPAGPGWFMRSIDSGMQGGDDDRLEVWSFRASFPRDSVWRRSRVLETAPYDISMCGASLPRPCIPQPGTAATLDPLSNRLMWRLQYRNFTSHETLVTCQTIELGNDQAGLRWYELRRTAGAAWSILRMGNYGGPHRWMGSAAMDRLGNIAIGYTAANATLFPSIRCVGLTPGGTTGEMSLMAGTGSQNFPCRGFALCPRWGDYSSLNVDPVDDCTFWYTSQYYRTTGLLWRTRIATFRFPDCVPSFVDLCRFFPQACFGVPVSGLGLGRMEMRFTEAGEVQVSPLGQLCGTVFPCEVCPQPCGREHRFFFDFAAANLDPEVISIRLFDPQGREIGTEERVGGSKVLVFTPASFPAVNLDQDHFFAFELGPVGKPDTAYPLTVRLEVDGGTLPGRALGGDCNADGRLDISDAVCLFGVLFTGIPAGLPCGDGSTRDPANLAIADWQGDNTINIADGIALLGFLFRQGPKHARGSGCLEVGGCGNLDCRP